MRPASCGSVGERLGDPAAADALPPRLPVGRRFLTKGIFILRDKRCLCIIEIMFSQADIVFIL